MKVMTLKELRISFDRLGSHQGVQDLAQQFGLTEINNSLGRPMTCREFRGQIGGVEVSITERCYDRSSVYIVKPDRHEVSIVLRAGDQTRERTVAFDN